MSARLVLLAVIGLTAFVVTAAARFPLSAAVAWAADESLLRHRSAEGTIWRGALTGVSVRGLDLGRVDVALSSRRLALFRLVAGVRVRGRDVRANALIERTWSGDWMARGPHLTLPARLLSDAVDLPGVVAVEGDHVRFDDAGRCVSAEATIRTNALSRFFEPAAGALSELSGPLRCDDGAWVFEAIGRGADGLVVEARGSYALGRAGELRLDVRGAREDMTAQLALFGFTAGEDGALSYVFEHDGV